MHDVLQKIVQDKYFAVEQRKQQQPLDSFISDVKPNQRNFYGALRQKSINYILECKKASPSKGLIRKNFNLKDILDAYIPFASCLSVLTDEKYFQGSFDFLEEAANYTDIPLLCKDFFVDPYQVYYARYKGASAILLMLSVLDDAGYQNLSDLAHKLNMAVLTEVHTKEELQRALGLKAKLIGINNRNLKDLSIDLSVTEALAKDIPDDVIVISESGIQTFADIQRLRQHCNGFLIGSSLMEQEDLPLACKRLFYGENKICGLTKAEDAKAAYEAGSIYGGLIFVPSSKRCVSMEKARQVTAAAPLQYVGVFQNDDLQTIKQMVKELSLAAVQLHGSEDDDYIAALRNVLPESCKIWKAASIEHQLPLLPNNAHMIVFDTKHQGQSGGTGKVFNWDLLKDYHKETPFMIAGGLNPQNVQQAMALGAKGLDFNSGVEIAPGIKDHGKIHHVFQLLRGE